MRVIQYFLGFCFIFFLLTACHSSDKRRVLVIHSYEDDYVLYPEFNKLIAKEFSKSHLPVEITTFYLDCERYKEKDETIRMKQYLDSIKDWNPDIILVNEDQATYSLLSTFHPLVKRVPIVFSGVNYPNWTLIKQYPNVTGFHDKIDFPTNLRMIRDLAIGKNQIYTILDYTFIDRKIRADIDEQLSKTELISNLDWHINRQESKEQAEKGKVLFTALSVRRPSKNWTANPDSSGGDFLWAISKYSRMPYLQTKFDYTTATLASFSTRQRFTAINELFDCGYHFLGGYMTSLPTQVKEMVGDAARILHGEDVSQIPIQESEKGYFLDWNIMQKEGLDLLDVPAQYTVINVPFKVRHPIGWWLTTIGVLFFIISLLIFITYLYWLEKRKKQRVLYDLEDERESLMLAVEGGDTYAWRIKEKLIVFENAFWRSLNMEPHPLEIKEFLSFVHPDYIPMVESLLEKTIVNGKHFLKIRCDFNGTGYQWWELRCSTMESILGGQKTTGLFLNIEEYKKREQELIEARQLAEKAELKESFLANMSHEIRTPLNAIVGFSNLLTSSEVELSQEEKDQFTESINHNTDILLKLINDILEISRIESGYMSFSYSDCQVASIIDSTYQTHQVLMPKEIEFIKAGTDCDLWIYADKERLIQVLTNLLNNAAKFTPQGYIKLGWQYLAAEGKVEIYVEDSGIGISPAEQNMIFTRFYKQNEFAQGTGLGLSICKVIVEKLQGNLSLWSEPGKGSRFSVFLPCTRRS